MNDDRRSFTQKPSGHGNFRVFLALGAVRTRPHMYIGDTQDGTGLNNMVLATVNAALRERSGRRADLVTVTLEADGSCSVRDDGPGLSGETGSGGDICEIEAVLTRFDAENGIGSGAMAPLCVVNTLSQWLRFDASRDGKAYDLEFRHGVALSPIGVRDVQGRANGTAISFRPSTDAFASTEFGGVALEDRLEALAGRFGARIDLLDNRRQTSA